MDRLVVPMATPFRPSRFSDPSYWNRYLPGVGLTWLGLFVVTPLLLSVYVQPTSGAVGTFTTSNQQRAVLDHNADYITNPTACNGASSAAAPNVEPVVTGYNNDGTVFWVHNGGLVSVTYAYGKPLFSPGIPLCRYPQRDTSTTMELRATATGTGYVYLPEPTGTVVFEIGVVPRYDALVLLFVVAAMAVTCFDIFITLRLRRATRTRFTDA